ncbi:hypothetical protein SDC9_72693 [bioreactor metagenome]|uniref:Uncharacterized protein n=1 Tax=bioreactor metagenome TaxID=1076179 RepID=A0A644YC31_9ZZZZ
MAECQALAVCVGGALQEELQLQPQRPGGERELPKGLVHHQIEGVHHPILPLIDDEEWAAKVIQQQFRAGIVCMGGVCDEQFLIRRECTLIQELVHLLGLTQALAQQ